MKTPTWESSPGALIAFVNAATQLIMADLYTIVQADGTTYRNTSAEVPVTVNSKVFGVGPKIARSAIKQSVGITVDTLSLDIYAEDTVLLGSTPLIQAFALGMLDNARIVVERCYLSDPITPVGTLMRFSGRVGDVGTERGHATVEVRSDLELFDVMIPAGVYQPSCRNTLYDMNCALSRASFVVNRTVTVGSTSSRLTFQVATSTMPAPDYLALGVAKCTAGANAGISRTIKRHTVTGSDSLVEVIQPWPNAVAAGDTFALVPGCDKKNTTCSTKFSNIVHFAAEPYVPLPDMIV